MHIKLSKRGILPGACVSGWLLFWCISVANGQTPSLKRFVWSGSEMGVRLQITVYSESAETAGQAIDKAVGQVQKCNRIFSDLATQKTVYFIISSSITR